MEGNAISTALQSGLTSIANDAVGTIADVLPIALIVVGASLVITIGVKMFKRVAGK